MKAVILHGKDGPGCLKIKEVDTPKPAAGEVRVKLKASALNRRDYWMTIGLYPCMTLPAIPGSDGVGIIDAVGAGGDESLIGRQVVIYPARAWGGEEHRYGPDFRALGMPDQVTFAEYICIQDTDFLDKPVHFSWEQAAAIPLAGLTAWRALVTHGEVQAGHKVLVTSAGSGVSSFAIQWAVACGAEVYVTSGSEEKIAKAKAMGACGGVNYRDEGFIKALSKMSSGFDIIIDGTGGDDLNPLLRTLNAGGRYVFFGATLGNPSVGLEMAKLFFKHIRIQGTTLGSPKEFGAMIDFVNQKKIEPLIHAVYALDDVVAAHRLMENFSQMGKIVLRID